MIYDFHINDEINKSYNDLSEKSSEIINYEKISDVDSTNKFDNIKNISN